MDISGEYVFDAPQETVWNALLDPNVLGSIMPGGKGVEQTADNEYKGVLEVKVGPVQGTFQGEIKLSDIKAPESYHMQVDGKGAPGFVKASGGLVLTAQNGQTHMTYNGQAQIGGRIASVGQRLLDSSARSIIRQSLEALNEYLKLQAVPAAIPAAAAEATASESPAGVAAHSVTPAAMPFPKFEGYKPPSQTTLAVNVAKDVLSDFIPAKYRPWVAGGVIVVIAVIVWLIVSR